MRTFATTAATRWPLASCRPEAAVAPAGPGRSQPRHRATRARAADGAGGGRGGGGRADGRGPPRVRTRRSFLSPPASGSSARPGRRPQVRHENVVQVYEVGEQPLPYLAMEFIPGETLQQRLDRIGPLDVAEVVRIGRQIAEGLAAAHATDLIHRDIKPGNVLLEGGHAAGEDHRLRAGPGRRRRQHLAERDHRRHADVHGPGAGQGATTLDQRADLFSLGSVLYQMAAGRPPFRANSTLAVLKRVAEDTPRPSARSSPRRRSGCATSSPSCTPRTRTTASSRPAKWPTCSPTARPSSRRTPSCKDFSPHPPRQAAPRSGRRKWVPRRPSCCFP